MSAFPLFMPRGRRGLPGPLNCLLAVVCGWLAGLSPLSAAVPASAPSAVVPSSIPSAPAAGGTASGTVEAGRKAENPVPVPAPAPALDPPAEADSPSLAPASAAPASSASAGTPEAAYERALTAYRAGALDEARRGFLEIVAGGGLSAGLAHNLGNIEFRRGQPGQAVLWYRRALALNPLSSETLQNLRAVRRQEGFVTFDPYLISVSYLKPETLKSMVVLTAWAAVLLLVWLLWLPPRRGRRWPLVVLLCAVVLPALVPSGVLLWMSSRDPHPLARRQVVSGEKTQAFAAPAESSGRIIELPAGSEVIPVETRGNWVYCLIPAGEDSDPVHGWVRSARLEPLWPWKAPV